MLDDTSEKDGKFCVCVGVRLYSPTIVDFESTLLY